MSEMEAVFDACKRIEHIIVTQWHGDGKGLHEKLSNTRYEVPEGTQRRIRWMATMRNKLAHEYGFKIPDVAAYLATAVQVEDELARSLPAAMARANAHYSPHQAAPGYNSSGARGGGAPGYWPGHQSESRPKPDYRAATTHSTSGGQFPGRWGGASIIIAVAAAVWFLGGRGCTSTGSVSEPIAVTGYPGGSPSNQVRPSAPAPEEGKTAPTPSTQTGKAESLAKKKSQEPAAQVAQSSATADQSGSQRAGDLPPASLGPSESNSTDPSVRQWPKPSSTSASNIAVENSVVEITNLNFSFSGESFGRPDPRITMKVKNLTDATLSNLQVKVRVYIDGESSPAASPQPLYVHFGDLGLRSGQEGNFQSYASGFESRSLSVPDILAAKRRILVMRVESATDGRRQTVAVQSQPWPTIEASAQNEHSGASSSIARAVTPKPKATVSLDELKAQFRAGNSLGLADERVEISNPQVVLGRDSWGSPIIKIRAEVANLSGATIATMRFDATLMPKTGSREAFGRESLYAFFGSAGLPAGARKTIEMEPHGFGRSWRTPDALSAVGAGQSRIILRLETFENGRNVTQTVNTPTVGSLL